MKRIQIRFFTFYFLLFTFSSSAQEQSLSLQKAYELPQPADEL